MNIPKTEHFLGGEAGLGQQGTQVSLFFHPAELKCKLCFPCTVELLYNELLYNEDHTVVMNDVPQPINSKMYGKEPRYSKPPL